MICGRPSTLSGTARAAASETAPRMPLQPTAKRWPKVSPASPHIEKTKASRTASEASAIAAAGQSSSLIPEELSLRVSTTPGSCRPSSTKRVISSPKTSTLQNGDGAEAGVGVERTRRLVAGVDAGDDGGEDPGDLQLLGADVGAVGGQHGEEDDQAGVGLAADHEVGDDADHQPDGDPAQRDDDELEGRVAEAEGGPPVATPTAIR